MKICRECKKEFDPDKTYYHTCLECYRNRPLTPKEERIWHIGMKNAIRGLQKDI